MCSMCSSYDTELVVGLNFQLVCQFRGVLFFNSTRHLNNVWTHSISI